MPKKRKASKQKTPVEVPGFSLRPYRLTILFLVLITLQFMFFQQSAGKLAFTAADFQAGEWWRIFTANFVHSNAEHFLYNFIALAILGYFLEPRIGSLHMLLLTAFSMCVEAWAWMQTASPDSSVVGFSGTLYAYYVILAYFFILLDRFWGTVFTAIVIGKVALSMFGIDFLVTNAAHTSHVGGAFVGIFACVLLHFGRAGLPKQ